MTTCTRSSTACRRCTGRGWCCVMWRGLRPSRSLAPSSCRSARCCRSSIGGAQVPSLGPCWRPRSTRSPCGCTGSPGGHRSGPCPRTWLGRRNRGPSRHRRPFRTGPDPAAASRRAHVAAGPRPGSPVLPRQRHWGRRSVQPGSLDTTVCYPTQAASDPGGMTGRNVVQERANPAQKRDVPVATMCRWGLLR